MRHYVPVPLKGLDSDNGAEFINWHLKTWRDARHITFTMRRQHHKNDNAFVEQKNGGIVRKTIGCGRLPGDQALAALEAVYAVLNPLSNFFYPNLKCVDKRQAGQKKRRVYEKEAKTPFQRILEQPDDAVPPALKQRLIEQKTPWISSRSRISWTRLLLILMFLFIVVLALLSTLNPSVRFYREIPLPASVGFLRETSRTGAQGGRA